MTRVLPILLTLPLAAAFADTIKLKSGEVFEGHVLSSDTSSVTFEIQYSPTIVDQQTFPRAEIVSLAVEAGDEIAFLKIKKLKSPDTLVDPGACQAIIDKELTPFLKQYPASAFAPDVRKQVAAIQADLARLKGGDVKISGMWYDKASFDAEKYQIEAASLLEAMKQQIAAGYFPAAMNSFEQLQGSYQNSMGFVTAIPLGQKALKTLQQQLGLAVANLPQTKALRQATIDRTPIEERPPIQHAIDVEDARAAATAMLAQKNNQRFFTIFPFDEKGLQGMQISAHQTEIQLKAIDIAKLTEGARLVRQANEELSTHQLAGAETTIAQLKSAWQEYEGLGRMDQRLQREKDAVQASADKAKAPANP